MIQMPSTASSGGVGLANETTRKKLAKIKPYINTALGDGGGSECQLHNAILFQSDSGWCRKTVDKANEDGKRETFAEAVFIDDDFEDNDENDEVTLSEDCGGSLKVNDAMALSMTQSTSSLASNASTSSSINSSLSLHSPPATDAGGHCQSSNSEESEGEFVINTTTADQFSDQLENYEYTVNSFDEYCKSQTRYFVKQSGDVIESKMLDEDGGADDDDDDEEESQGHQLVYDLNSVWFPDDIYRYRPLDTIYEEEEDTSDTLSSHYSVHQVNLDSADSLDSIHSEGKF